ncbi:non-heme iron oxygenase ferredoxin subunit [Mycolicibacterium elephantis]|uniref:Rieske (2Fe-2S) protein n=1 Tax=Mycolicibacterium elephantis TaxID=81858 RepID=A0A0M2ZJK2_9MYCO|nr:non-heme iron oxygenase ferredoxin subunit [Mycolicibacterium elephantis]KKW64365.1 Rieske (2Fe-2S) protein [Mycolicibacterium elephantis]OBA81065.1 Rieske (2Fe-2S) protein [Mycolicibacterium elephantis]OBB16872.1 Rieske (2Fe-2S) protein [Mycolicibacterium elephantis]OBE95694.1 Rieske (2Fe-2S) protein [Mycolicibacterium elephantis]ORA59596.1 Rieske (2Fe-2S) protein [Mycolicibacterium elephantis]
MSTEPTDTLRWVRAACLDDVAGDEPIGIVVDGIEIALFNDDGRIFALADRCTHGNAKLSDGFIEDGCIECPLHQALFDLATGEVRRGPADEPVRSFNIRVDGDDIIVGL